MCNEGCNYIQFDEPVWTENVAESEWGADVLIYIIKKKIQYIVFPSKKWTLQKSTCTF